MREKPTLSIITVTYNSEHTLPRTIESIRAEKTNDVEYIIVDGNSRDKTVDVIKLNEDIVDRWISEKDNGIYDAMNKGMKMASGRYISYMNSDDWFEPGALARSLSILEGSDSDIIYGDTNMWSGSNIIGKRIADNIAMGKVPSRMPFSHQSCFIKRDLMISIGGFDPRYKLVADFNMIISILKDHSSKVERVPFAISGFSVGGASSNLMMSAKERLQIHLKHGLNPIKSYLLYFQWFMIGIVKSLVSPRWELKLRKFKTRYRL